MPRLLIRRALPSAALALASSVVCLLGLELGCRLRARSAAPASLASIAQRDTLPPKGSTVRLGHIVRLSPNPRIVYELRPGLDVVFVGARLTTNAQGFRGPAMEIARARPSVRIVGLGDSVMFGWGVADHECYFARLAARLSARHPSLAWEMLNTAVPGYNTVMEVETLEARALRFEPDLVLLNFVGNDLGLPNFVEERPEVLDLDRSFLLDFVRARLQGSPEPGPRLRGVDQHQRRAWREADLWRIPEAYRPLAGMAAWRGAMERLRRLADTHRFEILVLAHPVAPPFLEQTTRELGMRLVQTDRAVRAYAVEHGIEDPHRPPLTLTDADPHPTAIGHEIIASALEAHLRESGLIDRILAAKPR